MQTGSLVEGYLRWLDATPDAVAVEDASGAHTYHDLWSTAGRIAAFLSRRPARCVAILCYRGAHGFSGILGTLCAGAAYVPLNPKFPPRRTAAMITASGCEVVLVTTDCSELLAQALEHCEGTPMVVYLDSARTDRPRPDGVAFDDLPAAAAPSTPRVQGDEPAYLLFTSGSTGTPKGVGIAHQSVASYLAYTTSRYALSPDDRCSQTFDLTFDLSVHDMFVCWSSGATLCVVPDSALGLPASFIRRHRLTTWFSVPSVATLLLRARLLRPRVFESLRLSLFCGEALHANVAAAWQEAAPNAIVENLYGPTEATIAIANYRWRPDSPEHCLNGIVPIGTVFPQHDVQIADVSQGGPATHTGELLLRGPQVIHAYWGEAAPDERRFVRAQDEGAPWYRTGDLVHRDDNGILHFRGRADSQVKVSGFRVELLEVESVVRDAARSDQVAVVALPSTVSTGAEIVAIVVDSPLADAEILDECSRRLPWYMMPARIARLPHLLLNANGKVDRRRLASIVTGDEGA